MACCWLMGNLDLGSKKVLDSRIHQIIPRRSNHCLCKGHKIWLIKSYLLSGLCFVPFYCKGTTKEVRNLCRVGNEIQVTVSLGPTSLFLGQHAEDSHGQLALVDALVFHFLDVRQRVHGATEVGLPGLGVAGVTLHVFPCEKGFHPPPLVRLQIPRCQPTCGRRSRLTCVDGPLLEQARVLVHVPAVASCVLPRNGEHGLLLE